MHIMVIPTPVHAILSCELSGGNTANVLRPTRLVPRTRERARIQRPEINKRKTVSDGER